MASIVVVATYFGPLPFWMPAFLLSCRHNPDVQWRIYADSVPAGAIPANVAFVPLTIDELSDRTAGALGVRIDLRRSLRKVCDLKPAYGLLFEEDLKPYDFWVYSDSDVVWGHIRGFVTDAVLSRHDIVSGCRHKLAGHFTLVRNEPRTNRLLECVPDIAAALAHEKYTHLDETGLTAQLRAMKAAGAAEAWPRIQWDKDLTLDAKYQRALGDTDADRLWWREGRTFAADGTETMYLHFHKLKAQMDTMNFTSGDSPSSFAITRRGFIA